MTEYLGFLISASAVVALGTLTAHTGRSHGAVKLALGVMLLSASVVPLISIVTDAVDDASIIFDEQITGDGFSDTIYEKTAEDAFSDGIKKLVVSEFSVNSSEVEVCVFDFKVDEMRAEMVKIILSGSAIYVDQRSLRLRVENLGLGKCEVELEIG